MFCCMGVALSKKKVIIPRPVKTGDKIQVWENKKVIKTVIVK